MFAGGGASWAEAEMKAGRYRIEPAPAGTRPDLTGLSCRWNPIQARHGEIVSIIAVPSDARRLRGVQRLVSDSRARRRGRIAAAIRSRSTGRPTAFLPAGLDSRLAAAGAARPAAKRPASRSCSQMTLTALAGKTWLDAGGFDPKVYKRDVAENSDFRKFDDGLKMTLDIDAEVADRIESG